MYPPFASQETPLKRSLLPLALVLCASSAMAKDRVTFRYKPPSGEERPVVMEAVVAPQGNDFALRLRFHKQPYGKDCGSRCANATLLLDTDANTASGMKMPGRAAENGADLAIVVQGARDLSGSGGGGFLRVKVRRLSGEARTVDDGELIAEFDHRRDHERVLVEGDTVFLLVDATGSLPSGRKMRVIYHPPGSKAVQAHVPGILSGAASSGNVMIFRNGNGNWGRAPRGDHRVGPDGK